VWPPTWAPHSRLKPVVEAPRTLKLHLAGLLAFFAHRITNAGAEGLILWSDHEGVGPRLLQPGKLQDRHLLPLRWPRPLLSNPLNSRMSRFKRRVMSADVPFWDTRDHIDEALSAIRQAALDTGAAPSVTNQPGHNIPLGTLAGVPNAFLRSGRR